MTPKDNLITYTEQAKNRQQHGVLLLNVRQSPKYNYAGRGGKEQTPIHKDVKDTRELHPNLLSGLKINWFLLGRISFCFKETGQLLNKKKNGGGVGSGGFNLLINSRIWKQPELQRIHFSNEPRLSAAERGIYGWATDSFRGQPIA